MSKLTRSTVLAAAACGLALGAPAAHADRDDYGHGHWEYARVVSAEPVYHEVRISQPREECTEQPVTERQVYRSAPDPGAIILGAAIGGVIGHQFGHGHGRDAATAAGAMIGAGHGAMASSYYGGDRVVERTTYETSCRTVHAARYEERIDGYNVTYKYHGRLYRTHMPYDPGARMRVRVDVAPDYEDDLD